MYNILLGELFKFYKRPVAKFIAVFTVGIFLIAYFVMMNVQSSSDGITSHNLMKYLTFPLVEYVGIELSAKLLSFLTLIMICSLLGNEYGWNTHKTLSIRGTDKLEFINTKLIAVFLVTILLSLIGTFILVVFAGINQTEILTKVQPEGLLSGYFVPVYYIIFLYGMLLYLTAGLFATVVTKSSGLGISITMVYFFIGESILKYICLLLSVKFGTWLADLTNYLPGEQLNKMLDSDSLAANGISGYWTVLLKPALTSGAYTVLFYIGTLAVIKKRDILH